MSASIPGERNPQLTPYIIPFERFFDEPRYETCVLVTGTQMSKTDGVLDVIGWRLATRPRPQLYVGPSRDFVTDQFEPRLMALFDEAPSLAALVARGKRNKKTRKIVSGVSVRLAWAGSATSLASDQAGDVYIDEFDKMVGGVKGEGDAFTLAKARADTYPDRKIAITSTPKRGLVDIGKDPATGLEFWKVAETNDIQSPIWAKWQSGTRHHWAWRCPQCDEWFIPRVRDLKYPEGATPAVARRSTYLKCPRNGCIIEEDAKASMNATGQFIAPGQTIGSDGAIEGDPPDNTMLSLWVSGLASPFLSWGERIEELLFAEMTGDNEARQGAANKTGELWTAISGDAPSWQVIFNRREPYPAGAMPDAAVHLTFGADVQLDRIIYVIRAWGARATSWLVEHGELLGDTKLVPVWNDLADKISTPIDGVPIRLSFVDSGYRPGKRFMLPVNRVYEFCRRFKGRVYPTKGASRAMLRPLVRVRPDVTKKADIAKYGLELIRLDTDHWKSFVHERLAWPVDQLGAWHIHESVTEDYCRQLVSEVRVVGDSGKVSWQQVSRDNHYLDCESQAAAAGFMLGAVRLTEASTKRRMDNSPRFEGRTEAVPAVPMQSVGPRVTSSAPRRSRIVSADDPYL